VTAASPPDLPPRVVTLVLCRRDGSVIGALPPYEVAVPWWQEVGEVVEGALATHRVAVTVLRLLDFAPDHVGPGGRVTYLAEVGDGPVPATHPWDGDPNADEPLRLPWATPGGPAADVEWADAALASRGDPRVGPARQVRSWNLSSLWRLPTSEGAAWLKVVPPFFAHEGSVLARLDPAVVPPLLATEGPRVLLEEVGGEDQYGATGPALLEMVDLLVGLQAQWVDRADELLDLGLPDWRSEPLSRALQDLVARASSGLDDSVAARLDALVVGLPDRLAAVAGCGIPETLVHGDFHPGNVRGTHPRFVLLDWGDCGVGHPMLDQAAFLERMSAADQEPVRAHWRTAWQAHAPGCDPERAAELLAPVAALRQALIYQVFLDGIEPDERVYHAADPAMWLTRAAELAGGR
jgi:hypothetical protein